MLKPFHSDDVNLTEIGVDEAGRGPMFGPVFAAAVMLPREGEFDFACLKDSKRFSSRKRLEAVAEYIRVNAAAYGIAQCNHAEIDKINIRKATHRAMHKAIRQAMHRATHRATHTGTCQPEDRDQAQCVRLLVDGSDFTPITQLGQDGQLHQIPHVCITKGDNQYCAIAAASILAKSARDQAVDALCDAHPLLDERYGLRSNKGYGTAAHMEGIRAHGISQFHRRTFGACRTAALEPVPHTEKE